MDQSSTPKSCIPWKSYRTCWAICKCCVYTIINVHTLLCIPLTYTNVCWCILYKKQRSNHWWYIEDLWFLMFSVYVSTISSPFGSIIPSTGLHPALFGCHFMALPWKSLHSGVQGKLQVVKAIPHSLTSGNHTHLATATNPRAKLSWWPTALHPLFSVKSKVFWQNMMCSTIAMLDCLLSIGILSICEHCWSMGYFHVFLPSFNTHCLTQIFTFSGGVECLRETGRESYVKHMMLLNVWLENQKTTSINNNWMMVIHRIVMVHKKAHHIWTNPRTWRVKNWYTY